MGTFGGGGAFTGTQIRHGAEVTGAATALIHVVLGDWSDTGGIHAKATFNIPVPVAAIITPNFLKAQGGITQPWVHLPAVFPLLSGIEASGPILLPNIEISPNIGDAG